MASDFDLLVIGSGPAGQRAAVQAAKLGKRVAIAEHEPVVGGACINTGTIPSKTMRQAVLHLSGFHERAIYGPAYRVKKDITMVDLLKRTSHVIRNEVDVTTHQLQRNDVQVMHATASFVTPNMVSLKFVNGRVQNISAASFIISVGTETTRDPHIPFDGQLIFTSDDVLELEELPKTLAVIGAGVIGLEYGTMFATLGVRVTVIDKRNRMLEFVDHEIVDTLAHLMRERRITLRLGEEVAAVEPFNDEERARSRVRINLESGKQIIADKALYSIGRTGATRMLNLGGAGLEADDRGRLAVDENYRTAVDNIYAVGDVIGFPSLASTSMEQGRLAACHIFDAETNSVPKLFPYGIYTIPEISTVGPTEEELTSEGIPYEVGKATYSEIARGQIIGDSSGLLKLIFHPDTLELLGVHILGDGASELIHIGQAVLAHNGTINYFVNTVFNYPTLAECYKTAALDGINRLG